MLRFLIFEIIRLFIIEHWKLLKQWLSKYMQPIANIEAFYKVSNLGTGWSETLITRKCSVAAESHIQSHNYVSFKIKL